MLSAVEQHEYVHFHLTGHLDARELQSLIDITRRDGLKRVQPSKEHMFSYITLIVLADTIDPEAVRLIRKTRFRKNYSLTLHGWTEYHGGHGNIFQPLLFQSGRKRSEKNSGEQFSFQRQADKIPCTQKKTKGVTENMNGLVLLIISIAILLCGYIFYGRYLCKNGALGKRTFPLPHTPWRTASITFRQKHRF